MKNYSRIHRKRIPSKMDRVSSNTKCDLYPNISTVSSYMDNFTKAPITGYDPLEEMAYALTGRRFLAEAVKSYK